MEGALFEKVGLAVVAFVSTFAADFCWALYFRHVADRRPVWAGFWSTSCLMLGSVVTISYVHDPILLVPALLGGFAGTFVVVEKERRNHAKETAPCACGVAHGVDEKPDDVKAGRS